MNRCSWLLTCLLMSGCGGCSPDSVKPPGDQVMGTFVLHSKGIYAACGLPGFPANYDFEGTFSRFTDGGRVFFTVQGIQFDAGFDGQFASYGETENRGFDLADGGNCNSCEMRLVQTGTLALLSESQSKALGDVCPTHALDGGVPGLNEDAGIALPGTTDAGFDAVRACGELKVSITGEGFCDPACYSCQLQYRLSGERKK